VHIPWWAWAIIIVAVVLPLTGLAQCLFWGGVRSRFVRHLRGNHPEIELVRVTRKRIDFRRADGTEGSFVLRDLYYRIVKMRAEMPADQPPVFEGFVADPLAVTIELDGLEPALRKLAQAVRQHPATSIFRVVPWEAGDEGEWSYEPVEGEVLREEGRGLYIIKAMNVLRDGQVRPCHMDVMLPERVSDHAYFLLESPVRKRYCHQFAGEIIPTVAIDCPGVYELFYSRTRPELGIEVLRRGLELSPRKGPIAEDLGYILRDEGRLQEAAEAFRVAAAEGPTSYFIYGELAALYERLGDDAQAAHYNRLYEQESQPSGPGT